MGRAKARDQRRRSADKPIDGVDSLDRQRRPKKGSMNEVVKWLMFDVWRSIAAWTPVAVASLAHFKPRQGVGAGEKLYARSRARWLQSLEKGRSGLSDTFSPTCTPCPTSRVTPAHAQNIQSPLPPPTATFHTSPPPVTGGTTTTITAEPFSRHSSFFISHKSIRASAIESHGRLLIDSCQQLLIVVSYHPYTLRAAAEATPSKSRDTFQLVSHAFSSQDFKLSASPSKGRHIPNKHHSKQAFFLEEASLAIVLGS